MKKIILFLILAYSYSFSAWYDSTYADAISQLKNPRVYVVNVLPAQYFDYKWNNSYGTQTVGGASYPSRAIMLHSSIIVYIDNYYDSGYTGNKPCNQGTIEYDNGLMTCNNGNYDYVPNPDPLGEPKCRDIFQKDGQAYTCDPNNNEATPIPNSDGTTTDPEDGQTIPNCNDGYEAYRVITYPQQGSTDGGYNSHGCAVSMPNVDDGFTGDNGVTVNPDGSVTTPNPNGGNTTVFPDGSTTTVNPDGSTTSTPPTNTTGGSGSGSTGGTGSTGGDSGSGSSTGGTSGTGSTGGTTGTDTGSGSTGSGSGSTDTGGTSGTDSGSGGTGGVSGSGPTGGTGGTTPTDTATPTTGTGGDTGSTGTTTPPTTGTGSGNCNDSGLTLEQKELCKANTNLNSIDSSLGDIRDFFTPSTNNTPNALEGSGGLIDGVIGEYTTFKTNITNQGDTLKTLVYGSIDTVNQGFNFSISSNEVLNCPKTYELNLSSLNMANMNLVLDICEQTSKLKPYLYPLFLIMLSAGITILTFRMLGVLI